MCHKAAIYNTGHGIMILPALDCDFHIVVNGVAFKLLQFHFHLPSEGKIDGERFGLQMCMVHTRSNQPSSDIGGYDKYVKREDYKSQKDYLASLEAEKRNLWYRGLDLSVINVFFRVGKPSAFLAQFWNNMPMKADEGTTLEPMNLTNDILPLRNQEFFKFMGSLTTPPNREGLDYHVCWNIQEASAEQIKKYADMLADCGHPNGNSRPIQPTCGREIRLIKSTESALKRMTTGAMGVSRLKRFQSVAAYN
jgi:carbonic anhydrase